MTEHKEKANKPFYLYAFEQCRECSHPKYLHLLDMQEEPNLILGECQEVVKGAFCSCKEFMPPDNLDYIELLAKKKGIIPEEKDEI